MMIPNKTYNDVLNPNPFCSTSSGRRCINASPKRPPAEKDTKNINIFFKNLSVKDNVNIPIIDIRLTMTTEMIE